MENIEKGSNFALAFEKERFSIEVEKIKQKKSLKKFWWNEKLSVTLQNFRLTKNKRATEDIEIFAIDKEITVQESKFDSKAIVTSSQFLLNDISQVIPGRIHDSSNRDCGLVERTKQTTGFVLIFLKKKKRTR